MGRFFVVLHASPQATVFVPSERHLTDPLQVLQVRTSVLVLVVEARLLMNADFLKLVFFRAGLNMYSVDTFR